MKKKNLSASRYKTLMFNGRYISEKEALKSLELAIKEPRKRRRIKQIKEYLDVYLAIKNTPLWKRILERIFKKS